MAEDATPQPNPAPAPPSDDKEPEVPDKLSGFAAKVLNQLSLSAWLPAAFFAACLTLLVQLRIDKNWSISDALEAITSDWVKVLLLALPVLVLTTMLTQAFSYGSIRMLEGYWSMRGPASWFRTAMIKHHARHRERLATRRRAAIASAFGDVRPDYLAVYSDAIVCALERQAFSLPQPALTEPIDQRLFPTLSWRDLCKPWQLSKVDHLNIEITEYPVKPGRTLPTKLGNVIRATEDSLRNVGGDLQGFVMRRREEVPSRLRMQHDQFRDRLDMYCTLVFVSVALAIATPLVLWGKQWLPGSALVSLGFFGFAVVSYRSAVASARGYCSALKVIDSLCPRT